MSSDGLDAAFEDASDRLLPRRLQAFVWVCAAALIGYVGVDYALLPPPEVLARLKVRIPAAALFVLLGLVLPRLQGRGLQRGAVVLSVLILAVSLSFIGMRSETRESVGFFPAMLFMATIFPLPRRWLWGLQALLPIVFIGVLAGGGMLDDPERWRQSTGLFLALGVSIPAAAFSESFRRGQFVSARMLEAANNRLLELDRMRSQFVATVSHELRTPLSVALLALESSEEGPPHPALQPLRRLRGLVEGLHELSRLEAGALRAESGASDLPAAARALVDDFRGAFEAAGVNLRFERPREESLLVPAGPGALDRILVNLLGYSLSRAPQESEVLVRVSRGRQGVSIELCDRGPPLDPTRAFGLFVEDERSARGRFGLSLAQGLVEFSGGRLTLESDETRTSLRAEWPLVEGGGERRPAPSGERRRLITDAIASGLDGREHPNASPAPVGHPERPLVLIAEPHAELALHIADTLRPAFRTLLAHDLATALTRLETQQPAVVLTALRLGDEGEGLRLLEKVRTLETYTPVLVLTALAERGPLLAALAAGADEVMAKPFEREILRARVEALLRLRRVRLETAEARQLRNTALDTLALALRADEALALRLDSSGALRLIAGGGPGSEGAPAAGPEAPWLESLLREGVHEFQAEDGRWGFGAVLEGAGQVFILVLRRSGAFQESEKGAVVSAARYSSLRAERDRSLFFLARSADERRRLAAAVLEGQDRERRRLARDLHDGTGQVLTAAALRLDLAVQSEDPLRRRAQLDAGRELVESAIEELRALSRDLHPPTLTQFGLAETLAVLVRGLDSEQLRVRLNYDPALPAELSATLSLGVYRIAQTALANVVRHARASRAELLVRKEGEELVLGVVDDGIGFLVTGTESGVGLLSIRERAESLGGRAELHSAPGEGTRVEVRLPLVEKEALGA